MVAVVKPLHVISEKVVWATLLLVMVFFLGTVIGKWYVLFNTDEDKSLMYAAEIELPETIVIGLFVVIVAVCSLITVKSLKVPAIGEMPNVTQDGSQHRRATVTILILSLVFILINGGWIVALFLTNEELTFEEESSDDVLFVVFISTIAVIPMNSIINPLIYIARNAALNEYAKGILTKVVKVRRTLNI